jgi:hypothetical protein
VGGEPRREVPDPVAERVRVGVAEFRVVAPVRTVELGELDLDVSVGHLPGVDGAVMRR